MFCRAEFPPGLPAARMSSRHPQLTPNAKCAVCNDDASGFHYGVFSCEGCKVCRSYTTSPSTSLLCSLCVSTYGVGERNRGVVSGSGHVSHHSPSTHVLLLLITWPPWRCIRCFGESREERELYCVSVSLFRIYY